LRHLVRIFATALLASVLTVLAPTAGAQDSGLAFLAVGLDAESLALGNQAAATANGALANFWNPAGLGGFEGAQVAASHHIWISDVRTYGALAAVGLGKEWGGGAVHSTTRFGEGEAQDGGPVAPGADEAEFLAIGVGLGRRLGSQVRIGGGFKVLSEQVASSRAFGYAFDGGLQASFMGDDVRLGVALANVGEMGTLNVEPTKLPRVFRVGASVSPFRIVNAFDATLLFDTDLYGEVSHNSARDRTQVHAGMSGIVLETVVVRVGYLSNDDLRNWSFGAGLQAAGLVFDYALLPFEEGFGGAAHILTGTYSF